MKLEKGMPGAPWNLSPDRAKKELRILLTIGWSAAILALFAFAPLLVIGVILLGSRCVLLSWRKEYKATSNGLRLKITSIGLTLIGALEYAALKAFLVN